jgi:hypothetical protein
MQARLVCDTSFKQAYGHSCADNWLAPRRSAHCFVRHAARASAEGLPLLATEFTRCRSAKKGYENNAQKDGGNGNLHRGVCDERGGAGRHVALLEKSVTSASRIRIVTLMACIAVAVTSADARARIRVQKAHVRFLATSTMVRGTWGYNQDIFLAELQPARHGELQLVRLIDEYPNLYPPLPAEILTSQSGTVLKVKRDAQCDLLFGQVLLRTAPGDPMAILPVRLGYQPQMDRTPEARTLIPCYRTVR